VTTIADLIERALAGLDDIGSLGEDIEDEWTFVTELVAAQRERLAAIGDHRSLEPATAEAEAAIGAALDEVALITDPHRAIDWLSTFPDLVALGLREPLGGA
jgi:hypothetical protein